MLSHVEKKLKLVAEKYEKERVAILESNEKKKDLIFSENFSDYPLDWTLKEVKDTIKINKMKQNEIEYYNENLPFIIDNKKQELYFKMVDDFITKISVELNIEEENFKKYYIKQSFINDFKEKYFNRSAIKLMHVILNQAVIYNKLRKMFENVKYSKRVSPEIILGENNKLNKVKKPVKTLNQYILFKTGVNSPIDVEKALKINLINENMTLNEINSTVEKFNAELSLEYSKKIVEYTNYICSLKEFRIVSVFEGFIPKIEKMYKNLTKSNIITLVKYWDNTFLKRLADYETEIDISKELDTLEQFIRGQYSMFK